MSLLLEYSLVMTALGSIVEVSTAYKHAYATTASAQFIGPLYYQNSTKASFEFKKKEFFPNLRFCFPIDASQFGPFLVVYFVCNFGDELYCYCSTLSFTLSFVHSWLQLKQKQDDDSAAKGAN